MSSDRARLSRAFRDVVYKDARESLGLELDALQSGLAKRKRRKGQPPLEREAYTAAEVEALSRWTALRLSGRLKEKGADR